ncbi:TPR domain protein [Aphelenchoides avenae]|nr:TPR domain protein [Aphelenchus avenae]
MRRWDEALSRFEAIIEEFPENKEARVERQRALARIAEASRGVFDLRKIHNYVNKEKKRRIDVADYAGPVKVTDIPDKGKGLVTKEDVKQVVARCSSSRRSNEVLILYNIVNETVERNAQLLCKIGIIQALQRNPQQAQDVYSLYAGKLTRDVLIPEGVIDVGRIENICVPNSYKHSGRDYGFDNAKSLEQNMQECAASSTASHNIYGDIFVMHAVVDLKKGDEVMLHYIDPIVPYSVRKQLQSTYNFACDCRLCELDRKDPLREKRDVLH